MGNILFDSTKAQTVEVEAKGPVTCLLRVVGADGVTRERIYDHASRNQVAAKAARRIHTIETHLSCKKGDHGAADALRQAIKVEGVMAEISDNLRIARLKWGLG